jgi:hypothetical protein
MGEPVVGLYFSSNSSFSSMTQIEHGLMPKTGFLTIQRPRVVMQLTDILAFWMQSN